MNLMTEKQTAAAPRLVRPCSIPGCPELTSGGPCAAHRRVRDVLRGKTAERGYDAVWRRLRTAKLAADPFCELMILCAGRIATEVHHVHPIRTHPELRLEWSNLQSACKPCHSAKTMRNPFTGPVGGTEYTASAAGDHRAGTREPPQVLKAKILGSKRAKLWTNQT